MSENRINIGLLLGDPSGIGPELISKLLTEKITDSVNIVVIGEKSILDKGDQITGNNNNLKIPSFVKSVPSLIVNEDNNQHLLVGSDIFNWIDEILKNKKEEIMNWDPITMSGYSDDFSFIDEKETVNLDRSYCYISNSNDFKINTKTDNQLNYALNLLKAS